MKRNVFLGSAAVALAVGLGGFATGATAKVDMAGIAKQEYAGIEAAMCPDPDRPPTDITQMGRYDLHKMPPAKIFDNFYYVGMDNVGAWALTTSEGIILFEAMMVADWEQTIVNGLTTLRLDPAEIKYIVIGHAHNDHFGGAAFLQQKYGAKVLMGDPDWEHILTWPQIGTPAPIPHKDRGLKDGDTLTLGDTTVRFVATPGHTPGTISSLIPLKDGDKWHLAAYWGGISMGFLPPDGLEEYIASSYRLETADSATDVELSNHPWGDGTLIKIAALKNRKPGDPHPFVTGHDGVKRWLEQLRMCTREVLSDKRAAQD